MMSSYVRGKFWTCSVRTIICLMRNLTRAACRRKRKVVFSIVLTLIICFLVNSQFRVSYWWTLIVDRHLPRFLFLYSKAGPHASFSKLLINTSSCQIPSYDEWDPSIKPFVDNRTEGKICNGVPTHVEVYRNKLRCSWRAGKMGWAWKYPLKIWLN